MIGFERVTAVASYCEVSGTRFGDSRPEPVDALGVLTDQEREVYLRIPETVRYVPNDAFDQADVEETLFGSAQAGPAGAQAGLSVQGEEHLFLQYNYARYRLGLLIEEASTNSPDRARQMVLWYRRAAGAQDRIAEANLALVVGMAKRSRYPEVDFGDLIAEGNMALVRSIDTFDVSRGFRFSTYACQCIIKSFHRLAAKARRYRIHCGAAIRETMDPAEPQERQDRLRKHALIDLVREALRSERTGLTPVERVVVTERFGLADGQAKRSLMEVGELTGLSPSRVRRIQQGAIAKMRTAMAGLFEV